MKKYIIISVLLIILSFIVITNDPIIGTWYYSDSDIDKLNKSNYSSITFTRTKKVKINENNTNKKYEWNKNIKKERLNIMENAEVIAYVDIFTLSNGRYAMIITEKKSGIEYTYTKKSLIK